MKANRLKHLTILFSLLTICCPAFAQPFSVTVKQGNIWLIDLNDSKQQLTTGGTDTMPVLSPDKRSVAFIRKTNSNQEIWLWDISSNNGEIEVISKSSDDMKQALGNFDALQFSPDGRFIYFLTRVQGISAIHRFDIQTREEKFISEGSSLFIITSGKYSGYIVVQKHNHHKCHKKSNDDYWLLTPDGKEIKDIGTLQTRFN